MDETVEIFSKRDRFYDVNGYTSLIERKYLNCFIVFHGKGNRSAVSFIFFGAKENEPKEKRPLVQNDLVILMSNFYSTPFEEGSPNEIRNQITRSTCKDGVLRIREEKRRDISQK